MKTPAEKPTPKPAKKSVKETPGEVVVKEKRNYKLNAAIIQLIIDLTLNGTTAEETVKFLWTEYGIKVDIRTIYYHRKASRSKITATIDEEISRARANCPELATLTGRLSGLQATIDKERRKRRSSALSLTAAYSAADMAMYHAETLRLRYRESMAKFPERRDDEHERILRELEKRSHIMRNVTQEVDNFSEVAGSDFLIEEPTVIQGTVEDVPGQEDMPGEDILTGGS